MSIASRIRDARKTCGITQEKLATMIGVTKGAIANYENEVSLPKLELLCDLMNVLNVDANYLYQDEMRAIATGNDVDLTLDVIISSCKLLNSEGKEKVLGYIEDLVDTGKYKKK